MKSIYFSNRKFLSKNILSVFAGTAFFFLIASCNKTNLIGTNKADLLKTDAGTKSMKDTANNGHQHVNVRSMGAAADGVTDDTKAFQKAIDLVAAHGGGTVWAPPGDYRINADTSIFLKSNVILSMSDGARLIAAPSRNERYYIIKATEIQNASIIGGQIIGERDYHLGTGGEHGYGIAVMGCNNVQVKNTMISNCWGDGFIVGSSGNVVSTSITVKGLSSTNNRRQAISVIEVDGLLIDSCTLFNTNGTPPQDGIDIEPDVHSTPRTAQNITITNCDIYSNGGNGVEINARGGNIIKNVTIQYNKIHDNKYSGYLQRGDHIVFTNNWLYGNKYAGNHPHNTLCTNSVFAPNTYQAP